MAALSSSESLVIKPTRSAIGGGTVTFIHCSMSGGGGGVLPFMGYIGIYAVLKGMVFKQLTPG